MSHGASINSHSCNSEILHGNSREHDWQPSVIINSAPSEREIETQLVMDRLLREYLRPKSPWAIRLVRGLWGKEGLEPSMRRPI